MPSGAERDRAHRRRVGDDREHDLGRFRDGARRVGPAHAVLRSSGSALSRERFQPVTVCPAAISRGTISCAHGAETDEPEVLISILLLVAKAHAAVTRI